MLIHIFIFFDHGYQRFTTKSAKETLSTYTPEERKQIRKVTFVNLTPLELEMHHG